MASKDRKIYVLGHKNPDTDSIAASVAYATLKNRINEERRAERGSTVFDGENDTQRYEAARCGNISSETQYVIDRFDIKAPQFIGDVRTQVRDMEIRNLPGVDEEMSLYDAWIAMKQNRVVTLCITEGKKLKGLITTGDIMGSYMGATDPCSLSKAHTSYANIVNTIAGDLIVGDIDAVQTEGKVLIGAGTPDVMEEFIEPGDMVILADRYESHLCAIEMGASCLIISGGKKVTESIQKIAKEKGVSIITTPFDTFTVARLINQSMPIRAFMKSDNLLTFKLDDFIEDIQPVMAETRHRYFPVVDSAGRYKGMVSRRNFLGASKKKIILVDHNERTQAVNGMETADILEIIDHHRLGTVTTNRPVYFRNQPLGSTCTIIFQMYREAGIEIEPKIAGLMLSAIISDTLLFRSPTCTDVDRRAGEELARIANVDPEELAREMFHAGSNLGEKTPDEIIHQDFKKFKVGEKMIGVGQLSSMDANELTNIREMIQPELQGACNHDGLDMIFIMLTNIINESSEVVFFGDGAEDTVESGFGVTSKDHHSVSLAGVVSRKKQMLPTLSSTIQMRNSRSD